jgi:hypothetical protein
MRRSGRSSARPIAKQRDDRGAEIRITIESGDKVLGIAATAPLERCTDGDKSGDKSTVERS